MVKRFIIDVDTDGDHDLEDAGYVTTVTRAKVTSEALGPLMSVLDGSNTEVYGEKIPQPMTLGYISMGIASVLFILVVLLCFTLCIDRKCARFILVKYDISESGHTGSIMSYPKTSNHIFQSFPCLKLRSTFGGAAPGGSAAGLQSLSAAAFQILLF